MADIAVLRDRLTELERVVVAFSGGADSAFLTWVAHDTLGAADVLAVTAVSPSLAADEREACSSLVSDWGVRWREVETAEMQNAAYRVNDGDRCYWCKDALMDALDPILDEHDAVAVLGVNLDDLGDHRPGQRAASRRGAAFPLVDAGFTKADVRAWSRRLGLRTWDKPAAPCLASRLPYGTPVTMQRLGAVERAEHALRALGFAELRVRHYGELARIEVPVDAFEAVLAHREAIVDAVTAAGYRDVTLDLRGLRSGNLNDALE